MSLWKRLKTLGWKTQSQYPSATGTPYAALLCTNEFRTFDTAYSRSRELKDQSALASALKLRQEATQLVRDFPVLVSMGKHHEMVLEYHHMGFGIEARKSALQCMTKEEEFDELTRIINPTLPNNYFTETMECLINSAESFEESLHYSERLNERYPSKHRQDWLTDLKDLHSKVGRWYSAQRNILSGTYSRATPELDQGKYGIALSIIDLMLSRAQAAGYSLDYEEYVDLLDDMCALALSLFLRKMQRRPIERTVSEDAYELGGILKKPMAYLADFMPDCQPNHRALFHNHYAVFKTVPWINELPDWPKLEARMTTFDLLNN
jgi:hypothetical protein